MRSIQQLRDERYRLHELRWKLEESARKNPRRYDHINSWNSYCRRISSLSQRIDKTTRLIRKAQKGMCKLCGGNLIPGSHGTINVGPPVKNLSKCDTCGNFFGEGKE